MVLGCSSLAGLCLMSIALSVDLLVSRKFLTVECCEQAAGFVCATACDDDISISQAITNLLFEEGNDDLAPQTAFFNAVKACLLVG